MIRAQLSQTAVRIGARLRFASWMNLDVCVTIVAAGTFLLEYCNLILAIRSRTLKKRFPPSKACFIATKTPHLRVVRQVVPPKTD